MAARSSSTRKAPKGEYIETETGNKISRRAQISGTPNIRLAGKTVIQAEVQLRGDLHRFPSGSSGSDTTAISIGKYTVVSTGSVLKPPGRIQGGEFGYVWMRIGNDVLIGPHCIIQSASISNHVSVGAHSILEPFSIVKDNVKILPHTIVPERMVIPPNVVVGGRPARIIEEIGEGWGASADAEQAGEWVEGGDLRELVRSIR